MSTLICIRLLKLTFTIDHLCKPDLRTPPDDNPSAFERYRKSIERLARFPNVYMKLSGAFSELPPQDPESPLSAEEVLEQMRPWLVLVFKAFDPAEKTRIMFGSDWPVCNVGGPGPELSWRCWTKAVETILDDERLGFRNSEVGRQRVWAGTALEAYGLEW